MSARIEVTYKGIDTRASSKKSWLKNLNLEKKVKEIFVYDVYTIDKNLSSEQLKTIASLLANPVVQKVQIIDLERSRSSRRTDTDFYPKEFSYAIEVAFLPGVADNVGLTAKEEIEDALKIKFKNGESVYYSQLLIFKGKLTSRNAEIIADNLANSLIQRVYIKNFQQFKKDFGIGINIPKVILEHAPEVEEVNLNVSDKVLQKIGKEGIVGLSGNKRGPLALNLDYMKAIQKYFKKQKRNPTDIELETLGQTWSEHCKHTIFADPIDETRDGLFKTYIKGATEKISARGRSSAGRNFCVSTFKDNSGAIEFDENYLITHKVETHNTPSALEPFGGALTGIVGVNRDTIGFGLGAKPIANTYGFMLADPRKEFKLYRSPGRKNPMLSPRRIMEGVVSGVNVGGNCSGIPTPQGFVYFDDSYAGKPLVFCGTIGLIPRRVGKKNSWEKKAVPGDYIVMVGGRVGLDGIHGVTFASEEIHKGSPASAVQIGDPITQKKFSDALIKEARDLNLYNSITDNGGGGLSSSVGEMSLQSGGCVVNLEKIPLKYTGLDPWQIWISESQERMTLSVSEENWKEFKKLMESRGVEATIIGKFTNSGKCIIKYGDKVVVDLDLDFLHNGLPKRQQKTQGYRVQGTGYRVKQEKNPEKILLEKLRDLNIASFEFISTQYDHTVLSNSVIGPLQGKGRVNGEATLVKPLLDSNKGLVLSQGYYPELSNINPYQMAGNSIDIAIRNSIVMGADPQRIALLDNFCWCSSDDSERLWQLKQAAKACFDFALDYGTPFISGKDSMFNDFKGFDKNGKPVKISVLPTLLISSLGIIDDVKNAVTIDFKNSGDLIYLLGNRNKNDFIVDAKKNKKLYLNYYKVVNRGLVSSGIAVTRGGLGVALAKSAISGRRGVDIKTEKDILFSQPPGRILVSINPKNKKEFEKNMKGNFAKIGEVRGDDKFNINMKNILIRLEINKMRSEYEVTFKGY